jgi:hypothetical protein
VIVKETWRTRVRSAKRRTARVIRIFAALASKISEQPQVLLRPRPRRPPLLLLLLLRPPPHAPSRPPPAC